MNTLKEDYERIKNGQSTIEERELFLTRFTTSSLEPDAIAQSLGEKYAEDVISTVINAE